MKFVIAKNYLRKYRPETTPVDWIGGTTKEVCRQLFFKHVKNNVTKDKNNNVVMFSDYDDYGRLMKYKNENVQDSVILSTFDEIVNYFISVNNEGKICLKNKSNVEVSEKEVLDEINNIEKGKKQLTMFTILADENRLQLLSDNEYLEKLNNYIKTLLIQVSNTNVDVISFNLSYELHYHFNFKLDGSFNNKNKTFFTTLEHIISDIENQDVDYYYVIDNTDKEHLITEDDFEKETKIKLPTKGFIFKKRDKLHVCGHAVFQTINKGQETESRLILIDYFPKM